MTCLSALHMTIYHQNEFELENLKHHNLKLDLEFDAIRFEMLPHTSMMKHREKKLRPHPRVGGVPTSTLPRTLKRSRRWQKGASTKKYPLERLFEV